MRGLQAKDNPWFFKYYDMENGRHFPHEIQDGEEVVVTEKIHGMSARVGVVIEKNKPTLMIGSHNKRRRFSGDPVPWYVRLHPLVRLLNRFRPVRRRWGWMLSRAYRDDQPGLFERPLVLYPRIGEMLRGVWGERRARNSVILYGEIYGPGIQDLTYGVPTGEVGFRAFDIAVDNKYLDYSDFKALCVDHDIAIVPELYTGPYSIDTATALAAGKTTLMQNPNKNDWLEGVVVRTTREQATQHLHRAVVKFINPDYLTRQNATEDH